MSLKQAIKQSLYRHPALTNRVYRAMYAFRDGSHARAPQRVSSSAEEVFSSYFESNAWADAESRSGVGSNLASTELISRSLPELLRRLGVRTFLDAPCGDLYWMRQVVDAVDVRYIGGDIVPELIAKLEAEISDPKYTFQVLDIVSGDLPKADLWLSRDCFIHLPHAMVRQALGNFYRSGIPYLLASQYDFPRANADIPLGGFRCINLRRAPFNLPAPREELFDFHFPSPPRQLALWYRDQIPEDLRPA